MLNTIKERYKEFVSLLDKKYKDKNMNFVFEVPSNYCIYPNYEQERNEGYLVDGYHEDYEYSFIDDILTPLDYNELMESSYGWENGNTPLFTKEELVEMLNQSKFITAYPDAPYVEEAEEIEHYKPEEGDYKMNYTFDEQSCLERIEDEIATLKVELGEK